MEKKVYRRKIEEKRAMIDEIHNQINKLENEYCIEHAPFKIGDKIQINDKQGYITDIQGDIFLDRFEYKWKPINKNGKPGHERKIWSFDVHKIIKV